MRFKKIDIKIKDNKRFGLVAFLMDKPEFLKDITKVRQILKLTTLPYKFNILQNKQANIVTNYYHKEVCRIYDVYNCFKDICNEKNIMLVDLDKTLAQAVIYAEALTRKYNKSDIYLPVILAAILVGKISNDELIPTNTLVLNKKYLKELHDKLNVEDKSFVIFVNNESTLTEITEAFRYIQKYYFGNNKVKVKHEETFNKIHQDQNKINRLPDTISNIKRDREWYWQNIKGLGYTKIWKRSKYKNLVNYKEVIIKAIQQYKRNLDMET